MTYPDPNATATTAGHELNRLRAQVERVEALHFESAGWCDSDGFGYPCPTIRALRGES